LPRVRFQKPLDQPLGNHRTLDWMVGCLGNGQFRRLRLISAFAKEGPIIRLAPHLKQFRARGGTAEAILGIDQQGTSLQALTLGLAELDRVYIWHHPSPFTTFHPKLYLFDGNSLGEMYIGSNNLTVGGLETNCEAGVLISYDLPAEAPGWAKAEELWSELPNHQNIVRLDLALLAQLREQNKLFDETVATGRIGHGGARSATGGAAREIFPFSAVVPPSVRPKVATAAHGRAPRKRGVRPASAAVTAPGIPSALVIQIVPHHNGEVFLSKRAINQYPSFFGFPFTGQTIPKTAGNKPYPQRTPDPLTTWKIHDRRGKVVRSLEEYPLNTVFYELKGEIRVTIPPDVARQIPERSILVMARPSADSGLDYQCDVFPPNSDQYRTLLPACNETMPAGGPGKPRKFGWL
jgi:PLD-like domain